MFVIRSSSYSPVITSSPSEDHTYSAGGIGNAVNGVGNTAVVTGVTVGVKRSASISASISTSNNNNNIQHSNSDNNSNGTLSDAAYESSEEG